MEHSIHMILGVDQALNFIPALVEICNKKNVMLKNHKYRRINFLQSELTGVLFGEVSQLNYVVGWLEGYETYHKLNKKTDKAPTRCKVRAFVLSTFFFDRLYLSYN